MRAEERAAWLRLALTPGLGARRACTPGRIRTANLTQDGLLLSELALGAAARAHNFPRRDRPIAALAMGILVVEATVQTGSLSTARLAAETGRELFAIPGSIHCALAHNPADVDTLALRVQARRGEILRAAAGPGIFGSGRAPSWESVPALALGPCRPIASSWLGRYSARIHV